jgi:MFS family permease
MAKAEPGTKLVIAASSVGTVFEWYDFFIWGTLTASGILQRSFFPPGDELLATLLAWATFAVGFAFRPLGAILFGYLGDRLGRKYTFLVTITLMGVATAGIGLIPSYAAIGVAAPLMIILLRIFQGLALGGEYGGAAIYVAEHSPPGKAGFYTSFIQASVVGGFILSLAVVLFFKGLVSAGAWSAWGWRLPFLFSILLLAVSLWMRLKLSESPVFKALKDAGETAANPFKEAFTYPGNLKRLFVALFGIAAGLTVIWYTAMFSVLGFLQGPMRVDETAAQLIVASAALLGLVFFVGTGALSDRIGRKKPIVIGYALTLVLLLVGGRGGRRRRRGGGDLRSRGLAHRRHRRRDPCDDVPVGNDLRVGGGLAVGDVSAENPLQLDVDPLSFRHRLFRRLPAFDQRLDHRQNRQSLFGPVVYVGRGGDGAGRHDPVAAGDGRQAPG